MRYLVTPTPNFAPQPAAGVSSKKRLGNISRTNFFREDMIFLTVQTLGNNKIGMKFSTRGGAGKPLSAPGLYRNPLYLGQRWLNRLKWDFSLKFQMKASS